MNFSYNLVPGNGGKDLENLISGLTTKVCLSHSAVWIISKKKLLIVHQIFLVILACVGLTEEGHFNGCLQ